MILNHRLMLFHLIDCFARVVKLYLMFKQSFDVFVCFPFLSTVLHLDPNVNISLCFLL